MGQAPALAFKAKTMINFFRRIRKKLADDNKPLKYMRYAIGEIVLVVLGILIALQINNWNEDRIKKIREKEIVQFIYDELAVNAHYIDERNKEFKLRLSKAWELLGMTGAKATSIHPDSLGKYTETIFIMGTYSPYKMNLTRIIHGNEFNLIRYDSLRSFLGDYEILLDQSTQLYESISSQISHWELIDHGILTSESLREHRKKYGVKELVNINELRLNGNTKDILSDPKFAGLLSYHLNQISFLMNRFEEINRDIDEIRYYIERHYNLD